MIRHNKFFVAITKPELRRWSNNGRSSTLKTVKMTRLSERVVIVGLSFFFSFLSKSETIDVMAPVPFLLFSSYLTLASVCASHRNLIYFFLLMSNCALLKI